MPSEKTQVIDYEGSVSGQIGDILWYDGSDWIRLSPGIEGQILTVTDIGGSDLIPRWQDLPSAINHVLFEGVQVTYNAENVTV